MAIHEIPNQALCKYKGDVDSPDKILNLGNKGLLFSRGEDVSTHMWVGIPLPNKKLPEAIGKCKLYINNDGKLDSTKQRIGIYYSNTENGAYNDQRIRRISKLTNEHENGVFTFSNNNGEYPSNLYSAKSMGVVIMHETAYEGRPEYKFGTPQVVIKKIELCDAKDNVLETIDFYDYALNSTPFLVGSNVYDTATIAYTDSDQANKNKLKLSKGDIYTFKNKGYIWDGSDWKYLGNNPDLSKYQLAEDNALNTEDKTIVGAINEVQTNAFGRIDWLGRSKQDKISVIEESGLQWLGEEGTILGIDTSIIAPRELVDTLVSSALTREIKTNREILNITAPSYDNYPSNIIYMLPSENEDGTYDEYMNVNNKWELIGSTAMELDLSDYVHNDTFTEFVMDISSRVFSLEQSLNSYQQELETIMEAEY